MESSASPPVHSCQLCQTLCLGSGTSGKETAANAEAPAKLRYNILGDSGIDKNHATVFNCSLGRMKQASTTGCLLCKSLLRTFQDKADDSLLTVEFIPRIGTLHFGLVSAIGPAIWQLWQECQDVELDFTGPRHEFRAKYVKPGTGTNDQIRMNQIYSPTIAARLIFCR